MAKIKCPTCRVLLLIDNTGYNRDTYYCKKCGLFYNITSMYGRSDWRKDYIEQ
jgi:uncharacterized protein YbaR (Trm112 family)